MSRIDELKNAEIADLLDISIKTVEAPFYLIFYLYGGLGALLDNSTHDYNKPKKDSHS